MGKRVIRRYSVRIIVLFIMLIGFLVVPINAHAEQITNLQQLDGKKIGIVTGTIYDGIVKKALPNAKMSYFNGTGDLIAALESGKIDGFPGDEPALKIMLRENNNLKLLEGYMDSFDYGAIFPKSENGEKLCTEFNEWLNEFADSGKLDELINKWTDGSESEIEPPDFKSLPATNGVLTMASECGYAPFDFISGDSPSGAEIDMAMQFCKDRGYGLKVIVMNFDGILPYVQTEKANFAMSAISVTEERKESVLFSAPYYVCGLVMAVKNEAAAASGSWWDSLVSSFKKTFIEEDRWTLFVSGILATLFITLLSILFGTLLGFVVFLACRNGNKIANFITKFFLWLIKGMPMVVLLMILFYIVFGSLSIGGALVSVIGFTLTFGSAVFGMMKMGVATVDRGQTEAAYALGHSNRHTFFTIVLPQALPHILPAYRDEVVSLIKATAVVGYIAVQDLTKVGDLIRSRTFEAFFPLIAITVFYFLLEALLGFLVGRIEIKFDPRRRSRKKIMKGVTTDDPH